MGRAHRRAGDARRREAPELAEQVKALRPDEVIDELLAGAQTEHDEIAGPGGLLQGSPSGWCGGQCMSS